MSILKFVKCRSNENSIIKYVLDDSSAMKKRVLKGNPDLVKQILANSSYDSGNYYHMIYRTSENYSDMVWDGSINDIEKMVMAGYEEDEYEMLAVQHDSNHIHLIIPKLNLNLGTKLNVIDFVGKTHERDYDRFDAIRDHLERVYFRDEKEVEMKNTRFDEEDYINQQREERFRKKFVYKKMNKETASQLEKYIEEYFYMYATGEEEIEEKKAIIESLMKESDITITKFGYEKKFECDRNPKGFYVTILDDMKKPIRLQLGVLNEHSRKNERCCEIEQSQSETRAKIDETRLRRYLSEKAERVRAEREVSASRGRGIEEKIDRIKKATAGYIKENGIFKKTVDSKNTICDSNDTSIHSVYTKSRPKHPSKPISRSIWEKGRKDFVTDTQYEKMREKIKEIDMIEWMNNHGFIFRETGQGKAVGKLPWNQDEDHESASIFVRHGGTQVMKDFVTDEVYDIVDLVKKIECCDTLEAMKKICNNTSIMNLYRGHEKVEKEREIKAETSTFHETATPHKSVDEYLSKRKIFDRPDWLKYGYERTEKGWSFFYAYFVNEFGGKFLYNETTKRVRVNDKQGYKHIDNGSNKTVISEGMFDSLSIYQVMKEKVNYVILNSTTNVKKFLENFKPRPEEIFFLNTDNDVEKNGVKAGDEAKMKLYESLSKTNHCIDLPNTLKDANEDLMNDEYEFQTRIERTISLSDYAKKSKTHSHTL